MNKKLVISIVVAFVLGMVAGFVVHGGILHAEYARLSNLMRTEEAAHQLMGLMLLAQLCWATGFCWIYARGREAKPWPGQGLRYGIAVSLLAVVPMYLTYYVVMPFPSDLVAQQIVFDALCTIVIALVVAWINR
jgi:cytochrome bd-type quinol oxidase subunit 2